MSPSPRQDASGVLVGMVPVSGRGWSTGGAEVADSRRRHWLPKREVNQDAVGVPAALRWQTAAGDIGNPTGTGPGRGWSAGGAEVADRRRKHWRPDRALDQDAVGVPAALRWQTVAGGIGSRKGKGPTKWEGPPAAVCHLSATKQRNKAAATNQPLQTSCNKTSRNKNTRG